MAAGAARFGKSAAGRRRPLWIPGHPSAQRDGIRLPFPLERLEDRIARTRILRTLRYWNWTGARLHSSPQKHSAAGPGHRQLDRNFYFRRWPRGTLLSRLGAKPAGASRRPPRRPGDRISPFRVVALQQEKPRLGAFQLALRITRNDRRNLLRPGLERAKTRPGLCHHAHMRGLALVFVVLRGANPTTHFLCEN